MSAAKGGANYMPAAQAQNWGQPLFDFAPQAHNELLL
jgi:hypothetical protein